MFKWSSSQVSSLSQKRSRKKISRFESNIPVYQRTSIGNDTGGGYKTNGGGDGACLCFSYHSIVVSFNVGESRIARSSISFVDEMISLKSYTLSFPIRLNLVGISVEEFGVGVFFVGCERI